jgi:signal peptidase I
MLSLFNLGLLFVIICQCFIYFYLALRVRRQPWLLSLALVVVAGLVLPITLRLMLNISTARVRHDGYSMGITLPNGSYILADRLAYHRNDPQRGDIIVFSFPLNPDQELVKRVVGLPGETISVQDGIVSVNGSPLEETYITSAPLYNGRWEVPEGQYFVLGDNRNDSMDSHQWGFLPRENIIAKAVWIYFPVEHFGEIDNASFPP